MDTTAHDLAALAALGELITYSPEGLPDVQITALFQQNDERPQSGELESSLVVSFCAVSLDEIGQEPTRADTLVRGSQTFRVKDWDPDETQFRHLRLELQP